MVKIGSIRPMKLPWCQGPAGMESLSAFEPQRGCGRGRGSDIGMPARITDDLTRRTTPRIMRIMMVIAMAMKMAMTLSMIKLDG